MAKQKMGHQEDLLFCLTKTWKNSVSKKSQLFKEKLLRRQAAAPAIAAPIRQFPSSENMALPPTYADLGKPARCRHQGATAFP